MNILVIGASSAIATAVAKRYSERQACLFLIARNVSRLELLRQDLKVRGATRIGTHVLDLLDHEKHEAAIDAAIQFFGDAGIDLALICHGSLPDQKAVEKDFELAQREIDTNGLSTVSLLIRLAPHFEQQGHGLLAIVTSVAGDRGRQTNFVYGAAKALVSTYLQGLRGKLLPSGVHVMDIRPGLVDSPMTQQFEKGLLWSSPELVAEHIEKAVRRKRDTVYIPGYWRLIMAVVRSIPEAVFKRLKF
ncbi:MAG: short-chain dehydrogenase [Gammaproteobacteria bacterium]|nr:short-chain dehydrogenase [Gammaproteobacteria bacterium]HBW82542.1 short-chain dehydrogenase [Gammaproteobacteria bacterium]|tara:strand:+ start:1620 stop:2360 length:741 start_codon:yes stop_codon:yes gene_type:complete